MRTASSGHEFELERRTEEMVDSLKRLTKDLNTPLGTWRAVLEEQSSAGECVEGHIGTMLATMALVPVPIHLGGRLRREGKRRHVVLAFALRLPALRIGTYPAARDALVPTLLDAVPTNPRDGKPITYELTQDGCLVGEDDDAPAFAR